MPCELAAKEGQPLGWALDHLSEEIAAEVHGRDARHGEKEKLRRVPLRQ